LAYARPTVVGDRRDGVAMEPFIGSTAIRTGRLTRRSLARGNIAIHRDVYLPRDVEMTALIRAHAAWLATGATLCGSSAAAMFGTKWLDPSATAEIVRADRHPPPGIVVHTWELAPAEVCRVRGVDLTTPARTAFDIGRTRPLDQAIPAIDAVLNATRITLPDVIAVADAHPGGRGVARLRRVLDLVDGGAESPQETRVRLLIVRGGLPRPETQIEFPTLHIRVDMGWRQWKVAVEYDGVQHWTDSRQRAWDIERIALLEAAGWVVIRVSGGMLARPDAILDRIRSALRARGCPV
jgi:very-short-patch-repair endonuclease